MTTASTAHVLGLQIKKIKKNIARQTNAIALTQIALKLAFVTTLILYFIFCMGFYVKDVWGLTTWLASNTSEYIAFILFLLMAIAMSVTLALIKHVLYEHKSQFLVSLGAVIIVSALGVFMEAFNSSSTQQHNAVTSAENSKTFASLTNTTITIAPTLGASQLPYYQGELAKHKRYLDGCKKTCQSHQAKVDEYEAKIKALESLSANDANNAANAISAGIQQKTAAIKELKEEAHKPVFKLVRDVLGYSISTAVVLVALLVAAGFEFSHALLSKVLGSKLDYCDQLESELIEMEGRYVTATGNHYASNTHPNEDAIAQNQTPIKQPMGFAPASQLNTGYAVSTVKAPLFKYQQQTPTPITDSKPSVIGFINTNNLQPNPTKTYRDALREGSPIRDMPLDAPLPNPKLGTHETQLEMYADIPANQNRPNPSPNASPNPFTSASEQLSDPVNLALLKKFVESEKFEAAFIDIATGSIGCSQKQAMKHHKIGGDTTYWLMIVLEAWEIASAPNQHNQRTLERQLTQAAAKAEFDDLKNLITGSK